MPDPSDPRPIAPRAVRGGAWVLALRVSQQVLHLVRIVVLARLLGPDEFGLLGAALLTMAVLETFSQFGFEKALIQRRGEVEEFLDGVWTILLLRGLVIFGVVYLAAPLLSDFFEAPAALDVIRVIGLSVIIDSLASARVPLLHRDLRFDRFAIIAFGSTVVNAAVSVTLAFLWRDVWALAVGFLASRVARTVLGYVVAPHRPRLVWEPRRALVLFAYGKWILGSNIVIFLLTEGDDLFVSKVLGLTALGLYQMAYRLASLPATEITLVINQVAFPAYAEMQTDRDRLRHAFLSILRVTALVTIPVSAILTVATPDIVRVLLGEAWAPMILPMQLLAIWGLVRALGACKGPLFQAVGRPATPTKYHLVRLAIVAACIYPFTMWWNLSGAAIALLVGVLLTEHPMTRKAVAILGSSTAEYARAHGLPLAGAVVAVAAMLLSRVLLADAAGIVRLVVQVAAGGLAYVATVIVVDRLTGRRLGDIVRTVRSAYRRPEVEGEPDGVS